MALKPLKRYMTDRETERQRTFLLPSSPTIIIIISAKAPNVMNKAASDDDARIARHAVFTAAAALRH